MWVPQLHHKFNLKYWSCTVLLSPQQALLVKAYILIVIVYSSLKSDRMVEALFHGLV